MTNKGSEMMVKVDGVWMPFERFLATRNSPKVNETVKGIVFLALLTLAAFVGFWAFGDFSLMGMTG